MWQLPLRGLKPVMYTCGDTNLEISLQWSQNKHYLDVPFYRLWGQMPWLTMEGSHFRQQYIRHVALYVHQLYISLFVNGGPPWTGFSHIQLHCASFSGYFWFHTKFLLMCSRSYVQWLHWHHHGGRTGICVAAASQLVAHWMKCLSVSSIPIRSHIAEVLVEL